MHRADEGCLTIGQVAETGAPKNAARWQVLAPGEFGEEEWFATY